MLEFLLWFVLLNACLVDSKIYNHHADKSKWAALVCGPEGHYVANGELMTQIQKCGNGPCIFECEASVVGLLNPNGTTSIDIFDDFIESVVPKQYEDFSKEHIRGCFYKYGQYIDPKDEQCVESKEFTDCVWAILPLLVCVSN